MKLTEFINDNIQPEIKVGSDLSADDTSKKMNESERRELGALTQELCQTGNVARKLDVIAKMIMAIGGKNDR